MRVSKQHIINEIKRTAAQNQGRPLGTGRFAVVTGVRNADWERYWVRWGDALTDAGFTPNRMQQAYTEHFVLQKLADITRELGRVPVFRELRHCGTADTALPNSKVFQRLGSKKELIEKLAAYCREHPEYADVARLLPVVDDPAPEESTDTTAASFGSVYLLKSGRYYRIGRSNAVSRRERELAIQLPDPTRVVHTITTDDPPGIEAYWHKRFGDRRKNGEWFELTSVDVAAFRRRRFM